MGISTPEHSLASARHTIDLPDDGQLEPEQTEETALLAAPATASTDWNCLSSLGKQAAVVLATGGFMMVSTLLILVNKHIIKDLGFGYPMVVGSMGMTVSSVGAFLLIKVLGLVESDVSISVHMYCTRMLPVGAVMAVALWSGNLVYVYLTVSFTQMLKATGPVITMVAAFCMGLETPTRQLVASVLIIAGGLIVASYREVNFSVVGVCVAMISEVGDATRLLMTQLLLRDLKLGPLDGLLYLGPASLASLFAMASLTEVPRICHVI